MIILKQNNEPHSPKGKIQLETILRIQNNQRESQSYLLNNIQKYQCQLGKLKYIIYQATFVQDNKLKFLLSFKEEEDQEIKKLNRCLNLVDSTLQEFLKVSILGQRKMLILCKMLLKKQQEQKPRICYVYLGQLYRKYNTLLNFSQLYNLPSLNMRYSGIKVKQLSNQLKMIYYPRKLSVQSNMKEFVGDYQKILQILISIVRIDNLLKKNDGQIHIDLMKRNENVIRVRIANLNNSFLWSVLNRQWAQGQCMQSIALSNNGQRLVNQIIKNGQRLIHQKQFEISVEMAMIQYLITILGPYNGFEFRNKEQFSVNFDIYHYDQDRPIILQQK